MLAFYVIPVAPGKSAILFSGFFTEQGMKSTPLIARLVFLLRPRWCVILTQCYDESLDSGLEPFTFCVWGNHACTLALESMQLLGAPFEASTAQSC